jgi:acetyl esterase/lipase
MMTGSWAPPAEVTRDEVVAASRGLLSRPDIPVVERTDIFRMTALDLDWDISSKVFEPANAANVPRGPDGRKIGVFLLHGGGGDQRSKEPMARLIASKLGWRVAVMSYPGHFYFGSDSHDWPDDTINPDGSARTPLWLEDSPITRDQYELIEDRSDLAKRGKWGTLFFLRARAGTQFYDRMAAWPAAFEAAMRAVCTRLFSNEYGVYVHGHSTGGPFVHIALQRIENVVGLLGMESSPFGAIYSRMLGMTWDFPFNYLTVRTWRHIAKYAGSEAGPDGAWRLPWIMEDVLDAWARSRKQPQLKSEYFITYGAVGALAEAARATAHRLGLGVAETQALIQQYQAYPAPLSGPGVKPLPPLLYGIAEGSRDHTLERYTQVVLPAYRDLDPAPRGAIVRFQAGVHGYENPEEDLPRGLLPAMLDLWDHAIHAGYYVMNDRSV